MGVCYLPLRMLFKLWIWVAYTYLIKLNHVLFDYELIFACF